MKSIVITYLSLFVFVCQFTYSQSNDIRVKNYMWNPADADFKVTKCDPRWKKESAVILSRRYEYQVRKEIIINNIHENIYTRSRILLNDKAAVENYSTFTIDVSKHTGYYFGFGANNKIYCGIKIVKPNGKETEVPIDKKLIDEVTYRNGKAQIQKIAVPNLEVGDILDYYLVCESTVTGNYSYYAFSPVLYSLAADYPIQKQKIQMFIMRKCYLSARPMNGAPDLKLEKAGEKDDLAWTITDTNREKDKEQQFAYPYRELPILAFQAHFVRSNSFNNQWYFIDKEDKVKSSLSDADFLTYFEFLQENRLYGGSAKSIKKYFNKKFQNETDVAVIARELYNISREYSFSGSYKYNLSRGENTDYNFNDYNFANLFTLALRMKKIDYSFVVTIPRELGNLNDLVMRPQMGYLIRVNAKTPMYFSNPTPYTLYPELDHSYQGCKVKYTETGNKGKQVIKEAVIPVSDSKDNVVEQTMNVSFDTDDAEKIKVQQNIKAKGLQKSQYQWSFISTGERMKEVEKNPYNISLTKVSSRKSLDRINELVKNDEKDRETRVTAYLKDEFGVENIKNTRCELVQPGMWDDKPEFIFNHDFEISHFITKAGENVILEVGKLIGSHVVPDMSDSVRLYNIYVSYPRTLEYTINVAIPEKYKVKGIDKLSSNVTNETGSFVSSAKIDGNKLVIAIKKVYASNYYDKAKWPLMVKFLNATIDFRNQKVMFVPKK